MCLVVLVHVRVCICACMHACVRTRPCLCVLVVARGQPWVLLLGNTMHLIFETGSLIGLESSIRQGYQPVSPGNLLICASTALRVQVPATIPMSFVLCESSSGPCVYTLATPLLWGLHLQSLPRCEVCLLSR